MIKNIFNYRIIKYSNKFEINLLLTPNKKYIKTNLYIYTSNLIDIYDNNNKLKYPFIYDTELDFNYKKIILNKTDNICFYKFNIPIHNLYDEHYIDIFGNNKFSFMFLNLKINNMNNKLIIN